VLFWKYGQKVRIDHDHADEPEASASGPTMRGSIYRRGDVWTVKIERPRRADGRRQYRYETVATRKEAERLRAQLVHDVNAGTYIEPCDLFVHEHLHEWLAYISTRLSARTVERYTQIAEGHLIPGLGQKRLVDLRPLDIAVFFDHELAHGHGNGDAPLAHATLVKIRNVLHRALREAVAWQRIAVNPATAVSVPNGVPETAAKARSLSEGECATLLTAALGDRLYDPVVLTLATGLRRGELLALRWCDVDLDAATLRVAHSLEEAGGVLNLKEPKTRAGRRTVPLPATAVQMLRRRRVEQDRLRLASGAGYADRDMVFCLPDGSPWRPSGFSVAFRRLVTKSGLDHARFHDLRHTHATQLLRAGVAAKVVSDRLGHANIAITLDIYSHVMPDMATEAAERIDGVLKKAMGDADDAAA